MVAIAIVNRLFSFNYIKFQLSYLSSSEIYIMWLKFVIQSREPIIPEIKCAKDREKSTKVHSIHSTKTFRWGANKLAFSSRNNFNRFF